jgi:hypothetical protein
VNVIQRFQASSHAALEPFSSLRHGADLAVLTGEKYDDAIGLRQGDPIEVEALTESFRTFTREQRFCALGSVKSNIGHLEAAAGVGNAVF